MTPGVGRRDPIVLRCEAVAPAHTAAADTG
jgi:hypothetical protein